MFLAGGLLSWYRRDPMPSGPSICTSLIVLFLAAGSHDLLAKLMYAHLLLHGGGSAVRIHTGAQLMFYGGDAIELALTVAMLVPWSARSGRQIVNVRRRATSADTTTVRLIRRSLGAPAGHRRCWPSARRVWGRKRPVALA